MNTQTNKTAPISIPANIAAMGKGLAPNEQMQVLRAALAKRETDFAQMQEQMATLQAMVQTLSTGGTGNVLTIKVKDRVNPDAKGAVGKGGVSVYGIQRNPVTLFASQWVRLLHPSFASRLLNFIVSHPGDGPTDPGYQGAEQRQATIAEAQRLLSFYGAPDTHSEDTEESGEEETTETAQAA